MSNIKKERKLIEVRCPRMRQSKSDGKMYPCKKLSVRVHSGSSGEAWCNKCKEGFNFSVIKGV